jgi:hypothetical protein
MDILSSFQEFLSVCYKNVLGFFQPSSEIPPLYLSMAPAPPESALQIAGSSFLTALQDYEGVMNIAALSITSKHVTLNAAIDRAVRPVLKYFLPSS